MMAEQQQIYRNRMREENSHPKILEILCIGEIQAGKSYFLKQYTKDEAKQSLLGSYEIYAKRVNDMLIYFHELSEPEDLYLQKQYDGIIFFVDLINTWNVIENILKWVEAQSRLTGINIFKIPIQVIVTKTKSTRNQEKEKRCLQQQLLSLLLPQQITYFEDLHVVQECLQHYFEDIVEDRARGIKSTNQNHIRLFGLSQILKVLVINVKLTFFRSVEAFEKHVRNRIDFSMKLKAF